MGRRWGVPARPGSPPPSPAQRSRGSHCPRRAEREGPQGRDADPLGLPGDAGSRPGSEPLPAGPRPPRPRGSPGHGLSRSPRAPGLVQAPGSRRPPLTPVGLSRDCHSPTAKTWGSCDRGGGAAHLGQVRSGDSPSGGYRCSPAQQPGPRADPSVPLCAQGCRSRMFCVHLSYWEPRLPGLGAEAKPAQPAGRVSVAWGDSLEIPPSPGAFVVAPAPSSSSSSGKPA